VTGVDSRTSKRTPPTTSFSVGAIKLGGVPIPTTTPQEVAAAMAAVNAAVKPLGLTITLPTIVVNGSGAEVTPLTASLTGNAALRSVLGPLYTAKDSKGNLIVNDVEQALKPSVWDPANCDELFGVLKSQPQLNAGWNQLGAGYPIVLGAVMAALTGGGSVDVHLGEAKVSVDDTYFSPIDFGGFGFDVSGGGGSFSTPGIAGGPTLLALAPGVAAPGAAAAPPHGSVVAATSTRCETTSPFGHPMCWGGHGAAAAAGVLGATVVLLAADELTRRRRRRPEAV
jgi:hypothetical protein